MKKMIVCSKVAGLLIPIFFAGCFLFPRLWTRQISNVKAKPEYQTLPGLMVRIDRPDIVIGAVPQNDLIVAVQDDSDFKPRSFQKIDPPFYLNSYNHGNYLDHIFKNVPYKPVTPSYFYFEISLCAKKDGFSFAPKDVFLLVGDKKIVASAFIVPNHGVAKPFRYSRNLIVYDYELENLPQIESRTFKLVVKKWTGFAIKFDTPPPMPGTNFSVVINGLRYYDKNVELPNIDYQGSIETNAIPIN